MGRLKVPLIALGWVVAIVAVVEFIVGYFYAAGGMRVHPAGIAIWLVFGALLTVPGRVAPRSAVLTAAIVLAVVAALGQLGLPDRRFGGPWYAGYLTWSSSYFTWIAVGVLLAQGLWGRRTANRETTEQLG